MEIHELVIEMKLLERRLTLYEEKYGVLSEDFYSALTTGKLGRYDEYDETRADFSRWKGIYETWRRARTNIRSKSSNSISVTLCDYSRPIDMSSSSIESPSPHSFFVAAVARLNR